MAAPATKFREAFKISKEKVNWYPGHMNYSFRHMQALMRKIDCIVEVHDARIPFSGRNPRFLWSLLGSRPHVLVLNKKDLIDKSNYSLIRERCLEDNCKNVVFTNCLDKSCKGLHQIIPLAVDLIRGKGMYPGLDSNLKMMVVGVPNVGKSSLINALRHLSLGKGKATPVGAIAGVTRSVQNKIKVNTEPPMYLVDTPGILPPNVNDVESGMKLALCACLNDGVVGMQVIADFLLYWMNKTENFAYVDHFGLKKPIDDIIPLLIKIAFDNNTMKKVKNMTTNALEVVPDVNHAAGIMVRLFRKGKLGDLQLDSNHLGTLR